METKLKRCKTCTKLRVIWKTVGTDRYCKSCWSCQSGRPKLKPTSKKSIRPRSAKKIKLDAEYSVLRMAYMYTNSMCQAHLPNCTNEATDVHHKSGRGINYLDTSTWMAVCRTCHSWIELHPLKAKALGYSTDRLKYDEE
jgi:hypothetical protein